MKFRGLILIVAATASSGAALAQFDSDSDGSDGAFAPQQSVVVDLSLGATASWNTPSPSPGNGVYDSQQWAVVFKYTTIDIPAGVTVTFLNHPSGAPVVWLASGEVSVQGTINLDGASGMAQNTVPVFAEPGPGGFGGARNGLIANNYSSSGGLGPGGGQRGSSGAGGGGAGYDDAGSNGSCSVNSAAGGAAYGNPRIIPLIGGSGGGAGWYTGGGACAQSAGGGGAGGGAILVASSAQISFSPGSKILARGGNGGTNKAGGGSGGGIRLVSNTISGAAELRANGGTGHVVTGGGGGGNGSAGFISVEAFDLGSGLIQTGSPAYQYATPFPAMLPSNAPILRVARVDGVDVADEPLAGMLTTDVETDVSGDAILEIEAMMPGEDAEGTCVTIYVIRANSTRLTYTSTPLVDAGGDMLTATATVPNAPLGRFELQLKWPATTCP